MASYAVMILGFLGGTFFMVYSALEGSLVEASMWLIFTILFVAIILYDLTKKPTNDDTIPLCPTCGEELECHKCIEIRQEETDDGGI